MKKEEIIKIFKDYENLMELFFEASEKLAEIDSYKYHNFKGYDPYENVSEVNLESEFVYMEKEIYDRCGDHEFFSCNVPFDAIINPNFYDEKLKIIKEEKRLKAIKQQKEAEEVKKNVEIKAKKDAETKIIELIEKYPELKNNILALDKKLNNKF